MTATQEFSAIEVEIQSRYPPIDKLPHIQILPHALMTSQKDAGGAFVGGHGEYEVILFTARARSFTEQISPWSTEGTSILVCVQNFCLG